MIYDFVYQLSHHAPTVIMAAAFLDIFFLSGYLLYGGATLGAVGMMHMAGMISIPEILGAALLGTLTGNQINYWLGRFWHTTPFIQKRLTGTRAQKAEQYLRDRGLLPYMLLGNFVTFFRPIHGLVLGAFNIRWWRFTVYDIIISFCWVSFWLMVILYGEKLWLKFSG